MPGELIFGVDMMAISRISIVFRVLMAVLCGGVLGFERVRKRRPAGARTYILVCVGAMLTMLTGQFVAQHLGGSDPARLGAQVISGIGFIGAGTIMVTGRHQIKGLTTAAGLWAAACMGLAIGVGFYYAAAVTCVTAVLVMYTLDWVQAWWIAHGKRIRVYVMLQSMEDLARFISYTRVLQIKIDDMEVCKTGIDTAVGVFFMLKLGGKRDHCEVVELLSTAEGVLLLEEI